MRIVKPNSCKRGTVLAIFLLINSALPAQRKDAALWAGLELEKAVFNKDITAHLKAQGRLNDNFTHIDYSFLDAGVNYRFNKYAASTVSYVLNFKNSAIGNNWQAREQFYANLQLKYKFRKLKFTDRNQFQTDLEDTRFTTEAWFYRNKVGITYSPFKRWSYSTAFESYFRLGPAIPPQSTISRRRYLFGVKYDTSKRSSIDLGYLIQQQVRAKQPDYIYAVTVGYNYEFDGILFKKKKKMPKPEFRPLIRTL